ncbi:MAG: SDR family NAD(P)-dependent oxidoreductase, partial [Moorea sp. SIO2I5]|nr:SDR family NAD(P)-dependent oxidoreductase [Moorena sp. SIO2I5]
QENPTQELICGSVLHLVQALVNQGLETSLWLVTQGGTMPPQEVQHGPIWGLARVIGLEHPQLHCRTLDLDPTAKEEEAVDVLVKELLSPDPEDRIAYRQGVRHVPRLVRHETTAAKIGITANGSYLVTGGLGALGLNVARWLVDQGARNLVLVGRKEPELWALEIIEQLTEKGATVLVMSGDISRREDAAKILEKIEAELPPLRGVTHAAGVLDDGLLQNMSWDNFARVMAPKVQGAWHLHELTEDKSLDFFVCFSSIASILGSPGQGNYAAANAFLDILAHYRRSRGLPGLSINWGPWAEVGMAANSRIAEGVIPIEVETGLKILGDLLGTSAAQVCVFPVNWSQLSHRFLPGDRPQPFFSALGVRLPEKSSLLQQEFLEKLRAVNSTRRYHLIITYLAELVTKILHLPQLPSPQQGFFDLGMDSFTAVELGNRLHSDLGISLSSTATFEFSNIEKLAIFLESSIGEEREKTQSNNKKTNQEQEKLEIDEVDIETKLANKLAQLEVFLSEEEWEDE